MVFKDYRNCKQGVKRMGIKIVTDICDSCNKVHSYITFSFWEDKYKSITGFYPCHLRHSVFLYAEPPKDCPHIIDHFILRQK